MQRPRITASVVRGLQEVLPAMRDALSMGEYGPLQFELSPQEYRDLENAADYVDDLIGWWKQRHP